MQTTLTSTNASAGVSSRAVPLLCAALFGAFLIGFIGMAPIDAVHNAGHDYRHSMGFPCH